ncbi:cadherin-like beta sandwich domain-containing protein [Neobacillus sp. Marseille-QA0830]
MFSKIEKKGVTFLLTVTLLSMGPFSSIPAVHAESVSQTVASQSADTLSAMKIAGIDLDKEFSPSVKEYSAVVANQVSSINLLVEGTSPNAKITINGKEALSGTAEDYQLNTGQNIFTIIVNDGPAYQLTVTRQGSTNNLLKNIELSTGVLSPSFSQETTNYSVQVDNQYSAITVNPTTVESPATVKVNGNAVPEGGMPVSLPVGTSTISIVVTAENGAQKTYTLSVTRASASTGNASAANEKSSTTSTDLSGIARTGAISASGFSQMSGAVSSANQIAGTQGTSTVTEKVSNAKLSSLSVSEGTWDSEFSSDEYTYHISVSNDVNTVTITPNAVYSSSSIVIEGGTSQTIQLNENKKTVISVVVNYSDDDRKTYVLVFDKN